MAPGQMCAEVRNDGIYFYHFTGWLWTRMFAEGFYRFKLTGLIGGNEFLALMGNSKSVFYQY